MTFNGWMQIALYIGIIVVLTRPMGWYLSCTLMADGADRPAWLYSVEKPVYWLTGIHAEQSQAWQRYAVSLLLFNLVGAVGLFLILRNQDLLPFNPQGFKPLSVDLALNTAVSFVTNTNWQSYAGESTMSHGAQMLGLNVQNFLSAATGIAVALVVIRGVTRQSTSQIGNFWVDITRITLFVLLPLSFILALVFVAMGVPQTLQAAINVTTLEGQSQTLAIGPVASQLAIKMLGTNGGGFFNSNSAHPFENPSALSNFLQMLTIFAIGAGLTNLFGRSFGDERQGWALLAAMGILFIAGTTLAYHAESQANPALTALGVSPDAGNMEGKETRFGIVGSSLFATITTAASCGAVNAMHSSFMPLGGLVAMINMLLGEIIIGGVGAGFYGMFLYIMLAIFLAGLMVGRTPEYMGKKIQTREIQWTMVAILSLPLMILVFTSLSSVLPSGLAGPLNKGPHGFSEILYAFTSATANNGSAFAGLTANCPYFNYSLALCMFIGRFAVIVPVLAIAGSLAQKPKLAQSSGTFPTHDGLFVGLLVGVILILGGLTFLPVLALGPLVDHLHLLAGRLF